ncbi:MAG: HlyC/CorC family transporter [Candidatus Sumerlaeia bacterium]|nr:HlyC/CorC family transporter [Candidatus Sumerlaeia bacterium]
MSALAAYAGLSLAAGLALQVWGEHTEARVLRAAGRLLRPAGGDEARLESAETTTVVQRTRLALAAARLARLTALALLLPGMLTLVRLVLPGRGPDSTLVDLLGFLALLGILLPVAVGSAWSANRRVAASTPVLVPDWLRDADVHPPALLLLGATIWDRIFGLADALAGRFGLARPEAQLVERDGRIEVRLAGEDEGPEATVLQTPPTAGADRTEEQMIRAIQRLDRTIVREIMRPINRVTAIRLRDVTPKRFLDLCRRTGFTRIPCYADHITNLIGYINVYDLLELDEPPRDLRELVTPALFVPEVARVDGVLQEMIATRQQVAIVFDEFGGTSGWLSREDILEEIVGDVGDEYERPRPMIVPSRGTFLVNPSVDLDDLKEQLGLELPKRHVDTIAGYVYARLGRVPRRGETIEERGWRIQVAAIDNHRIRRLRLIPPADESDPE